MGFGSYDESEQENNEIDQDIEEMTIDDEQRRARHDGETEVEDEEITKMMDHL